MSDTKKQNYLHGAAILTAGVVIIKILGAVYKIPLGNLLGDDGYGYFMTAYNIYNVFLTLATAGFPVALSRMISEAYTLNRPMQARRIFRVSLSAFAVVGLVGSLIMALLHTELAIAMNGPKSSQSILALSPAVLLCCLLSAYRGYCQGHSNMTPTTVGQILEVLLKLFSGFALFFVLSGMGKSVPVLAAGAIFGVVAGSAAALCYMMLYKRRVYPELPLENPDTPDSASSIIRQFLRIGIPITLGACVMSLVTLIDNKLVLYQLKNVVNFGEEYSDDLWGVYGKAMTLYNLPAAFITPLTISVVPSIASSVAAGKIRESCETAESSIRIASIICMPMGFGLAVLSGTIMRTVYPASLEVGGTLLMIMGIASNFVCLALISNAILQASGYEKYPVLSMIVGGCAKIGANLLLVGNPKINIAGAPLGTLCCYSLMCILNYLFMRRCLPRRLSLKRMFLRPLVSCAAMAGTAWAVNGLAFRFVSGHFGSGWIQRAFCLVLAVGIAALVYLVMIIAARAITLEDMKLIPKGEKLAKILHIRSAGKHEKRSSAEESLKEDPSK